MAFEVGRWARSKLSLCLLLQQLQNLQLICKGAFTAALRACQPRMSHLHMHNKVCMLPTQPCMGRACRLPMPAQHVPLPIQSRANAEMCSCLHLYPPTCRLHRLHLSVHPPLPLTSIPWRLFSLLTTLLRQLL